MFNLQPKALEALTELSGRIRSLRPSSLYVLVATTALMPLAQALRDGDTSAYMALGRLTSDKHTDRLADLVQTPPTREMGRAGVVLWDTTSHTITRL